MSVDATSSGFGLSSSGSSGLGFGAGSAGRGVGSGSSGLGLGGFGNGFMGNGTNGFGGPTPTLSFGNSDGSVWTPTSNPFATPSTSFSSLPNTVNPPLSYIPPSSHNPFSDSTISFGAADGSITSTSWAPPPQPKKAPTLPANPWDT
ncbi:hypothetical protein FS749_008828 [Ceratobasidium sp. UAMH 11750]|nr:hypothetical protein FS749_008828 [Ceratobasidium sp. UAMH 11750]